MFCKVHVVRLGQIDLKNHHQITFSVLSKYIFVLNVPL